MLKILGQSRPLLIIGGGMTLLYKKADNIIEINQKMTN
jgi:hypothetical protein